LAANAVMIGSLFAGTEESPGELVLYDGRSYNSSSESGVDLAESVFDAGDLCPEPTWSDSCQLYVSRIREFLVKGKIPFVAGGDHAVTVPLVKAFEGLTRPLHFIQIDAHPDLYPEYEGNPHSHACVAFRILEMKHIVSVTCLGVRTFNPAQRAVLEKSHSRFFEVPARECCGVLPALTHIGPGELAYLSIDLDGFDPAFAPGVSHPVPGGLTPRQVLNLIQSAFTGFCPPEMLMRRWGWGKEDSSCCR